MLACRRTTVVAFLLSLSLFLVYSPAVVWSLVNSVCRRLADRTGATLLQRRYSTNIVNEPTNMVNQTLACTDVPAPTTARLATARRYKERSFATMLAIQRRK